MAATTATTSGSDSSSPYGSWSKLSADLIESIHSKIELLSDYVRFRAVCKSWLLSTPSKPLRLRPQLPWLLLPYDVHNGSCRRFFSPADRDVHVLHLPETIGTRCCGSSFGWLLLLSKTPLVSLFNPLTRASIPLPPLTTFPDVAAFRPDAVGREYLLSDHDRTGALRTASSDDMQKLFLRKAVLSSDPAAHPESVLMVVRFNSKKLALCRVRGDSWTEVDVPEHFGVVLDVVHHRGKFYMSCSSGRVMVCNVDGRSVSLSSATPVIVMGSNSNYLVNTPSGELLLIARYVEGIYRDWRPDGISATSQFRVFRLDLGGEGSGLELDGVGDSLLFLGMNHSICVSAAGGSCGLKAGRIYYVDTNLCKGQFGQYDICAFDVENGKNELVLRDVYKLMGEWTLTSWVMPNIC